MEIFKKIFSGKKTKKVFIGAAVLIVFLIITSAAWKQILYDASQNDGKTESNAPAAAGEITKKVISRKMASASSSSSLGSNASMVDAALALVELTKAGGSEAAYYGSPRTSSNGFSSSCYVCASFVGETIYNATNGAIDASGLDGVNNLGEFLLNNNQVELIYYYPYASSISDISGAVNSDKNPEDLLQPGDIVGTYSGSYTFQHVMVYIGDGQVADQGGTGGDYPSTGSRSLNKSNVKYIFRLKNQGGSSSGTQVANLNNLNSLIRVVANGTSAKVTYEEKSGSTWKTIVSTNGYVGSSGVGKGSESDSKTPAGAYSLGIGFGVNTDNPGTSLTWKKITSSNWVWVDDPNSDYYNQLVDTNKVGAQSGEILVNISSYKYAIAINYNTNPVVKGAGSAIFLHCIGNGPTAGCVAIPESDLVEILKKVKSSTMIVIGTESGEYAIDKYISD